MLLNMQPMLGALIPGGAHCYGWVPLLAALIVGCDKTRDSAGNDNSVITSNSVEIGASHAAPAFDRPNIEANIDSMHTPEDFKLVFGDLASNNGIWHVPKEDVPLVASLFFRAWFARDPNAALAAIYEIPRGGWVREEAIRSGMQYGVKAPQDYFEALDKLLPEDRAGGLQEALCRDMFANSPDALFEFAGTKLAQGRAKQIALTTFFSLMANKDFRRAVEYASRLEFEEDKREAFSMIAVPGILPSQEDLEWALKEGMPQGEITRIERRMPK